MLVSQKKLYHAQHAIVSEANFNLTYSMWLDTSQSFRTLKLSVRYFLSQNILIIENLPKNLI